MPLLKIMKTQNEELHVPLTQEPLVIGRVKEADVLLQDPEVSRLHVQFRLVGTTCLVKDLNSHNGTFLNDVRLAGEVPLTVGDHIRIGQTTIVYLADKPDATGLTTPKVFVEPDDPHVSSSGFKADESFSTRLGPGGRPDDFDPRQHLILLNQLSRSILAITEEQELVEYLTQTMSDWFQADCCAVIYHQSTADDHQFEVKAMTGTAPDKGRDIRISHTVIRRVIEDNMALLITNAGQDRPQQSVVGEDITSVLCAPLWHKERVFGLLYLDTTAPEGRLNQGHLELLSAMANLGAIKIENLRLVAEVMARAVAEAQRQALEAQNRALMEANARLQELDQLKTALVSRVSHDLRTPLATIQRAVDNLLEGISGPLADGQHHTLTRVQANIGRLARLIDDLLDFAQIEAGQLRLTPMKLAILDVGKDVVETLQPLAAEQGVTVSLRAEEPVVPVWADPDRVYQVLMNLVTNGIKFTPTGGQVAVQIGSDTQRVWVTVRDTGVGISAEDMERIFEPFHRAEKNATGRQGVGLGLTIAKRLVELHGGQIEVASVVGQGSEFRFALPPAPSEQGQGLGHEPSTR